ncbi:MAG: hypothetical protein JXB88_10550 [Spirochaetales bacterium]|nr:hypothetical protein [Spirochaetales bacterium]
MSEKSNSVPANPFITGNLYKLYEFFGTGKGCLLHKGKAADWVVTKPSCWPNMIFNIRLPGNDFTEDIKEITEKIKHKEAPPFCIMTPETDPAVEQLLIDNGMIPIDFLPGMAIDLEDFIRGRSGDNMMPDLKIREVSNEKELLQWIDIVDKVIFKGKKLDPDLFLRLTGNPLIHFYTGYIQDIPATTSMIFISQHAAGFYNIATLPPFRKRGLGTAMTIYSMIQAYEKKCKTGILHASVMGEPVYTKLGYSHYGQYKVLWMAGKEFRDF